MQCRLISLVACKFIKTADRISCQFWFWNIYVEITQPPDVSLQHDADVSLLVNNTPALHKLRCLGAIALLLCLVAFLISWDSCTPALSEQRHSWPVLCFIEALIYRHIVSSHFRKKKWFLISTCWSARHLKWPQKIYLKIIIVKFVCFSIWYEICERLILASNFIETRVKYTIKHTWQY